MSFVSKASLTAVTGTHNISEVLDTGVFVEALIVAGIIVICLWQLRLQRTKSSKDKVKVARSPHYVLPSQAARDRSGDGEKVRRLVVSLMSKSGSPGDILEQYDALTRMTGVDLQAHVADESAARALFVGVVSASLTQVGAGGQRPKGTTDQAMDAQGRRGHKYWTNRVLRDMRRWGFKRSTALYGSLIRLFIGAHLSADALWLYGLMNSDGCVPDSAIYLCLFNAAIGCNSAEQALGFFAELRLRGETTVKMHMAVLRIFSANKDWQSAVDLVLNVKERDPPPDVLLLNHVLGLCVSLGAVAPAEKIVKVYAETVDIVSCNILLKGYVKDGSILSARGLLRRMQESGPEPNLITFNTAMDAEVKAMRRESSPNLLTIWALMDQLESMGLQADRYTCSTLLKGMHIATACSAAEIDRTIALLVQLGPDALHGADTQPILHGPNRRLQEVIFNTLLDVCVTARDMDRLIEVFGMMQSFEVTISSVTLGTLIKAFGQAGRLARCHEVWQHMWTSGITPAIVTYGCFIDACVRNDDLQSAMEAFQKMEDQGLQANVIIYTSLIKGHTQASQPGRAVELYRKMRGAGIAGTMVTFNAVLEALSKDATSVAQLQFIWDDMREAGHDVEDASLVMFLKSNAMLGNVSGALEFFALVCEKGINCDEATFNSLILACARASRLQDAEKVFGAMQMSTRVAPTAVTASILVKMYGKAKMLDKAIAVASWIETKYDVQPNLHVYTSLIQACVQNRQLKRGWDIFSQVLRKGLSPDSILYGTLVHGCIYANRFEQAMCLVRHAYNVQPKMAVAVPWNETSTGLQRKAVPLQAEVCQALMAAMKRREYSELCVELQNILAGFAS
mmetsp:Transcript_11857/g.21656  ORF Transcript_11857/g.21656 Transcript_11857/m.21656 type:complete len:852 (-) Transcript_11857:63-2618(-)